MSKTADLDECRKGKDFIRYAVAHGGRVEICAKGVKIYGNQNNGTYGYALIHSNHPNELPTGTRCALIKAFRAIGLVTAVLIVGGLFALGMAGL